MMILTLFSQELLCSLLVNSLHVNYIISVRYSVLAAGLRTAEFTASSLSVL
jgi:hypothetical protein